MNVETILKAKGNRVATIKATESVAAAVGTLRRERIGALVVSEDGGSVDGIISERDIVRALADHGGRLMDMRVEELMTRDVHTCVPEDSVERMMARMTEGRFRHLPVIEGGRLRGIVSIGDVVKNRLEEMETEAAAMRQYISSA